MPMQPGQPSWGGGWQPGHAPWNGGGRSGWQPGPQWGPTPQSAFRKPPIHRPNSGLGCFIALAVVGLGFVGLIGGLVYLVISMTAPVRDAGHAFLKLVRKDAFEAAWDSTSRGFQSAHAKDTFERELETFPEVHDSTDATFNSTSVSSSQGCLEGSLDTPSGGSPIHMRLVNERGAWRVDDLGPRPLAGCEHTSSSD